MTEVADALHQEAIKLWLAVQNETRGVGINRDGDLQAPMSHENFERFVYRNFPAILDAIASTGGRPIATCERPIEPTRILLYWPERGWITGTYDEPEAPAPNTPRAGFRGDGDSVIALSQPTHWMPLPPNPHHPEQ